MNVRPYVVLLLEGMTSNSTSNGWMITGMTDDTGTARLSVSTTPEADRLLDYLSF